MQRLAASLAAWLLPFSAAEVVELTSANFESSVQQGASGPWFLKFYAPWCGHCQRLAPTWERLAERLQGRVAVGKVDATREQGLAAQWAVEAYPTLILVAEGSGFVYDGARSLEAFADYALGGYRESGGASTPEEANYSHATKLTSLTLDAAVRKQGAGPWFINFHIPTCGHCRSLVPTWDELAVELRGKVNVAQVNSMQERPLAERWGVERFPTMLLVVGDAVYDYTGDREVAALRSFATGGYSEDSGVRGRALPAPLQPLPKSLWESLQARRHVIVAFVGGILFAGLVSCVWARAFAAEESEAAALDEKKEQ